MRKFAVLSIVLGMASLSVSAQVAITPQGFATVAGPSVPGAPVSPPVLYTPTVRLGTAPSTAYDAYGITSAPSVAISSPMIATPATGVEPAAAADPNFNFGAAQFDPAFGVSTPDDLGKAAAQLKGQKLAAKRSVTNDDIERISKQASKPANLQSATTDQNAPNGVIAEPQPAPAPAPAAAPEPAPKAAPKAKKK